MSPMGAQNRGTKTASRTHLRPAVIRVRSLCGSSARIFTDNIFLFSFRYSLWGIIHRAFHSYRTRGSFVLVRALRMDAVLNRGQRGDHSDSQSCSMFEMVNIRSILRNSRYQNCARTAEPSERLVVEYDVSDIHR